MTSTMASTLELREVFKAVSLCLREMVPQGICQFDPLRQQDPARPSPCARLSRQSGRTHGNSSDACRLPAGLALQTKRPVVVPDRHKMQAFSHPVTQLLVERGFQSELLTAAVVP